MRVVNEDEKMFAKQFPSSKKKLFSISTEQIEVKCECHDDDDDGICNISLYYQIQHKRENYVLKRRKFVQNYVDGNCVI